MDNIEESTDEFLNIHERNLTEELTDEFLNIHKISSKLGQGGQGIVHRTNDPDIAIKRVIEGGKYVTDKEYIDEYIEKIKHIKYLPFPLNINIATPIALLHDNAGYVMQLLTEMLPFEYFWSDANSLKKIEEQDIPVWLQGMPMEAAKEIIYYRDTGGLKRRLNALYNASEILARLHAQGLVYGDISPGNVFVSKKHINVKVWFVDPDNLRFYTPLVKNGAYTPKYGAPELVQGLANGSYRTDCHAYATMAFYMLSMIHPFIGEKVLDNDAFDDWSDDEYDEKNIDEQAYAGKLPWVDDRLDDSNQNQSGLPRTLILTEKLSKLFHLTFSAGREIFWKRPSVFHWTEALAEAYDKVVVCSDCQMSWLYDVDTDNCPYCNTPKPKCLMLNTFVLDEGKKRDSASWIYLTELNEDRIKIEIPERVFSSFSVTTHDRNYITVAISEDIIEIKKDESVNEKIYLAIENQDDGKFKELVSRAVVMKKDWKDILYIYIDSVSPRIIECTYGVQL